ncbi:MAG: cell division protein ZipA [Gammaproteobacteria bacterium]|jgi:cell division protein ZipA|nr:cell division protein ZipA [Gammaproteobacteria bacterium]
MDSNTLRLILIGLGVLLLVAIYLWDRLTRRPKSKAPRKLKRKARERRDPGLLGPAPDIDSSDEWRLADGEPEETPAVEEKRGFFGRRRKPRADPAEADAPPPEENWTPAVVADDRQPHLPFNEPAPEQAVPAAGDDTMIVVVNVVAKAAYFRGDELMKVATEVGLRAGEWNIFHRPDDAAPQETVFSMANLVEPGSFPVARMATFTTPGVCLFAQLPGPRDGLAVFADMLFSAERIASLLDGELQDERHQLLTRDKIEQLRERILAQKRRLQLARKTR